MTLLHLLQLAFRYLLRHFRRYLFLLVALGFGFGIITLITSLKAGMDENVYRSAQAHYAGDIIVAGYDHGSKTQFRITRPDTVMQAAENAGLKIRQTVLRTIFGVKGLVYFNGAAVRHKYVLGVDWKNEEGYFSQLAYSEGGAGLITGTGDIILSRPVARDLGAKAGDKVLLEVETRTGQKNTGSFIVRGVVKDSTIFGYYKCFISRSELNALLRYGPDQCSTVGFFLEDRKKIAESTRALQTELKKVLSTGPLVSDRDELQRETSKSWKGIRHFIVTVPVYLSEVSDLLSAMQIIAYFLYGMMILIILVSVAVTYRLILHEREKEIGTMRAVGFQDPEVAFILMAEVLFLFLLSLAAGFLFAGLSAYAVSFLSFDWIPSFDIFMKNGSLQGIFAWNTALLNTAVVLAVLLPAVWLPAYHASRAPLAEVLSGGNR